jgi:hypothetical protein
MKKDSQYHAGTCVQKSNNRGYDYLKKCEYIKGITRNPKCKKVRQYNGQERENTKNISIDLQSSMQ